MTCIYVLVSIFSPYIVMANFACMNCYDVHLYLCLHQELAITSDEALSLEELPKRAVILGGG